MVNQKALSLKLDLSVFDSLEKESYVSSVSKNRVINNAVGFYVNVLDFYRSEKNPELLALYVEKLIKRFQLCR